MTLGRRGPARAGTPASPPEASVVLVAHPGADLYGSDRMLLESVDGLVVSGHRVVVALPGPGPLVAHLQRRGAEIRFMPMPVLRKSALRPRGMVRLLAQGVRSLRPAVSVLRETRPSAVYVSTLTLPSWLLVSRLLGRPTVCHVHEADRHSSALVSRALVLPLLLADRLIANSHYTRSVLVESVPRLADRITVVHDGVTGPGAATPPRERVGGPVRLLFLGRLSPRKGAHVSAAAVRLLLSRGTPAELDVVGDVFPGYEWYEEELLDEFADLVESGHLHLRGFTTDIWPARRLGRRRRGAGDPARVARQHRDRGGAGSPARRRERDRWARRGGRAVPDRARRGPG